MREVALSESTIHPNHHDIAASKNVLDDTEMRIGWARGSNTPCTAQISHPSMSVATINVTSTIVEGTRVR